MRSDHGACQRCSKSLVATSPQPPIHGKGVYQMQRCAWEKADSRNPWYSQYLPTVSPARNFRTCHSGNGVQGAGGMSQRPSPLSSTLGHSRSCLGSVGSGEG